MADGMGDQTERTDAPGAFTGTPRPTLTGLRPRARNGFDAATLVGILGAFGLMAVAIALGGSPGSFVNLPSVLIVIGGTLLITTASFSLSDMGATFRVIGQTIAWHHREARDAAMHVLRLADFARHNGVLKMQGAALDGISSEPFLHKGLQLVIDSVDEDAIEKMLRDERAATASRQNRAAGVLRRAAEVSPAMGLIGTLIGLVQMLTNLQDPAAIGPGMAVALLTTFYGAILANMVFAPLASKVERNAGEEALVSQVYLLGVLSISRKDNPRRLEMQINSVLPPAQRVAVFD